MRSDSYKKTENIFPNTEIWQRCPQFQGTWTPLPGLGESHLFGVLSCGTCEVRRAGPHLPQIKDLIPA